MNQTLKKALTWLVVAFLIYALFKSPVRSAHAVTTTWDDLVSGVRAIGKFFDTLLGR